MRKGRGVRRCAFCDEPLTWQPRGRPTKYCLPPKGCKYHAYRERKRAGGILPPRKVKAEARRRKREEARAEARCAPTLKEIPLYLELLTEARYQILVRLSTPMSVTDLAEAFHRDSGTIHHHLKILRDKGLVIRRNALYEANQAGIYEVLTAARNHLAPDLEEE